MLIVEFESDEPTGCSEAADHGPGRGNGFSLVRLWRQFCEVASPIRVALYGTSSATREHLNT